jgi:hypothetical protein
VVVRAGDCRPGKHDRQSFFLPMCFAQYVRPLLRLSKKITKKAARPHGHKQEPVVLLADSFVDNFKSYNVYSLLPQLDHGYCFSSVYLLTDFVNLLFD